LAQPLTLKIGGRCIPGVIAKNERIPSFSLQFSEEKLILIHSEYEKMLNTISPLNTLFLLIEKFCMFSP